MKITRSFSLTIPEKDIYKVLRLVHLIVDPEVAYDQSVVDVVDVPTDGMLTVFFTQTGRDDVVNEKYRRLRRLSRGKPRFKIETSVWGRSGTAEETIKQQAILIYYDNDDQQAIVEAVENIGVRIVSNDDLYAICSAKGTEDEMKEFVRKVRRLSRGKPRFAITVGGCYNVGWHTSDMGSHGGTL